MNIKDLVSNKQMTGIKNLCSSKDITLEAAKVAAEQKKQELKVKQSIKNRTDKIREYKAKAERAYKASEILKQVLLNIMQSDTDIKDKIFNLPIFDKYKNAYKNVKEQQATNNLVRQYWLKRDYRPDFDSPEDFNSFLISLDNCDKFCEKVFFEKVEDYLKNNDIDLSFLPSKIISRLNGLTQNNF